jgi:CBS domain-containing protein
VAIPRAGRSSGRRLVTPMSTLTQLTGTSPGVSTDITALPVSVVMCREVLVVGPQDSVVEVWQRMQNVAAELAVVCDATRVVAVVSQHTLAARWPSGGPAQMCRLQVRDIVEPGIPTVHANATVREAAEVIIRCDLEGIPVVTASGRLLGLVTPTGLVRLLARMPAAPRLPRGGGHDETAQGQRCDDHTGDHCP